MDDSNLHYQPACRSRLVLISSSGFLDRYPKIQIPTDLPLEECVIFRQNGLWTFKRGGELVDISPNCRFNTTNPSLLNALICGGFGIAISPLWIVEDSIKQGRLVTLLDDYEIVSELQANCNVNFLYPKNRSQFHLDV